MSQQLINLSPDLTKLRDEGHEMEIKGAYLLVSHIPYVNSQGNICFGTLVSDLTLAGNKTTKPSSHIIQFIGDYPCHRNGKAIAEIMHQSCNKNISTGITINHSFSNKPKAGYQNYYDKFTRYIEIISAPAKSIDPTVTEKTFKTIVSEDNNNPFNYIDTNSSRAGINIISNKLNHQKIGIIGLGGTGSYIMDFIAKTPVREIHIFDGDEFVQHNAFRSPGAATIDQLDMRYKKVEYFKAKYSHMHKKIISHDEFISDSNIDQLNDLDFVFISIDNHDIKNLLFTFLERENIGFIDVGIGIEAVNDQLIGIIRTTTSTRHQRSHIRDKISFSNNQDDVYTTNIQIAELNALNAAMAVIKWKKLAGFYQDLNNEHHSTYTINVDLLTGDDYAA